MTEAPMHGETGGDLSHELLQAIVNALPIGVFFNDVDGQCRWVSEGYAELAGRARESLLGTGWQSLLVSDRSAYTEALHSALQTQHAFGPLEVDYRAADGSERAASVRVRAVRDASGAVIGSAGTVADVTRFKAARLELAASEERLRTVLTTIEEGIVMHDASGQICLWNDAAERILGLTGDQLLGRTSLDGAWATIDADGRPLDGRDHPAMVTLRTGAPVRGFIMGVRRGDALRAWIRVTSLPITLPGPDARPGVIASFIDITEQREAETRTVVRERLGGVAHLAGQLAHEYANALTVLQSRLELLGASLAPSEREHFEAAEQAIGRAIDLTGALRALGGREAVTVASLRVADLLPRLALVVSERMGVALRLAPPSPDTAVGGESTPPLACAVTVDADMLERVVLMLVARHVAAQAAMHTAQGSDAPPPRLDIALEHRHLVTPHVETHGEVPAGDWIVLRCAEAHRGWTEASLAPLMPPGAGVRGAVSEVDLDLPVALARMQAMGGHLSATRRADGGVIISLWLRAQVASANDATGRPAPHGAAGETTVTRRAHAQRTPWIGAAAVPADAVPVPTTPRRSLDGLRLLLVDDDPLVLRTAERLLQRAGAEVVTASSAAEAEEALDTLAPPIALIVTDVVMPGVSGPALIARRRAAGDMRPVVYMSGYTGDAFSEAALLTEDAVLVAKPFTTATLVAAIREAQGQAQASE